MKRVNPDVAAAASRANPRQGVSIATGKVSAKAAGAVRPDRRDGTGIHPGALARPRAAAAMPDDQINPTDPDSPLVTDWSGAVRGQLFGP